MASPWTFLALLGALSVADVTADCTLFHSGAMPASQPLLVLDNGYTDVRRLARSDISGKVILKTGDNITLACPSNYNHMKSGNSLPWHVVTATCSDKVYFVADGRTITVDKIQCYSSRHHDVLVGRKICGASNTISIEVGFNMPGYFLKVYELCFDQSTLSAVSSQHYVLSGARFAATDFISSYLFHSVHPEQAYVRTTQTASFTAQLGIANAAKYITTTNYFEAKQVVPSSDFVFAPAAMSTFFYFNTVPVWRSVSSAYWKTLEAAIRTLANTEGDLLVSSLISSTATLPNEQGISVPLFLNYSDGEGYMRIPGYLSKSVTNEANEQVIFLEVANKGEISRELSEVQESACAEDVCAQLRWLPWRSVPAEQRPIICCRADDPQLLRRLPQLQEQLQKQRAADGPAGAPLLVGSASEDFYARALALSLSQ